MAGGREPLLRTPAGLAERIGGQGPPGGADGFSCLLLGVLFDVAASPVRVGERTKPIW